MRMSAGTAARISVAICSGEYLTVSIRACGSRGLATQENSISSSASSVSATGDTSIVSPGLWMAHTRASARAAASVAYRNLICATGHVGAPVRIYVLAAD